MKREEVLAKYRPDTKAKSLSRAEVLAKYRQSSQGDSSPVRIGKSLGKAGANLVDLPQNIGALLQMGSAKTPMLYGATEWDMPESPEEAQEVQRFNISNIKPISKRVIDATGVNLEHNDVDDSQRFWSNVSDPAAELLTGGAIGKVAKLAGAEKIGNFLGGNQHLGKLTATGAGIGAGSGLLQEAGLDPTSASLISGIGVPTSQSLVKNINKNTLDSAKLKLLGLSPKNYKLDAVEAANAAGIDLPYAARTDSKVAGFLNQYLGKSPYFGEKIRAPYIEASNQARNKISNTLNKVSLEDSEALRNQISGTFERAANLLPQDATAKPLFTLGATESIRERSKGIPHLSPGSKELKVIAEDIDKGFRNPSSYKAIDSDIAVNRLIRQKQNLNDSGKLWGNERKTINQARKIGKGIDEDLNIYGEGKNPEWLDAYKKANKLHGNLEKRNELETILNKAINPGSDTLSWANLSKAVRTKKNANAIKKIVGAEEFNKLRSLGETAKYMSQSNINIPNPSGTTPTAAIGQTIGNLGKVIGATIGGAGFGVGQAFPLETALGTGATIGTAAYATRLITDKKFLNMAHRFAKEAKSRPPSPKLTEDIARRIQELTGLSPDALNRAVRGDNEL